jgi:hexosaminidase
MSAKLNLLPLPQSISLAGETFQLPENGSIVVNVPQPGALAFTAQQAQKALPEYARVNWNITSDGNQSATLSLTISDSIAHAQGYRLTIGADGIRIVGKDPAGVFYGVMTLKQLLKTHGKTLPFLTVDDWPDMLSRGVMQDISRDKVPTIDTLYHLIDLLASWKVNEFQLYTEHTFAYRNHKEVWKDASPMTAEEIRLLDAYCGERFIELVPNQNSFGHLHHWFEHKRYLPLAETQTGQETPWGTKHDFPFSLSPAVPEAFDLIDELFAELLPNFTSKQFNVGCDETFDIGMGRSKELVEKQGKGRVYLDFLLEIYKRVKASNHTMQFWGDIINQYPELVPELPKDTIALEWGYDAKHDFPEKSKLFAESGIPFYVCPGTSTWVTIAGRTDNCIGNIRNAVENGLKFGAIGVLNTDWGDLGHWQQFPISYLGFAYGAALGWAYKANIDLDLPKVLDSFVFDDKASVMGKLAYDLGNAYQQPGVIIPNSSLLFWLYRRSLAELRENSFRWPSEESRKLIYDDEKLRANLKITLEYIDGVIGHLSGADMTRPDADLVKREFAQAARMLKHGANRGLLMLADSSVSKEALLADLSAIEDEYRKLWLSRNRPGGLSDSAGKLATARKLYQ